MSGLNGLTLALPRGALMRDTSTCSTSSASTRPRCADDRTLLFQDRGIVTIPRRRRHLVEAGAADIGIAGKDVLAEHSERAVYELLDLGYGPS